jgi:HEAT repeat protein
MHLRSTETEAALTPLLKDEQVWVRIEAARALAWISEDPAEATAVLAREYSAGGAWTDQRREASIALAEIGPPARAAIPALLNALAVEKGPGNGTWRDTEGHIRTEAAFALSRIGWESGDAVHALVRALTFDWGHHSGPEPAAWALYGIGTRAIPSLLHALKGDDARIRRQSCVILGRLREDSTCAIPSLGAALFDPDSTVRLDAAQALGRIGPESIPFLIDGLKKGDRYASGACAAALEELGRAAEPAVPALLDALCDESGKGSHSALDALLKASPDPVRVLAVNIPKIRIQLAKQQAAVELANLDPVAAVPFVSILLERLNLPPDPKYPDDRQHKRSEGLHALRKMGPLAKEAVPALLDMLQRGEGKDPGWAVGALYRIAPEDPRVLSAFESALGGRNYEAVKALRSLAMQAAQGR